MICIREKWNTLETFKIRTKPKGCTNYNVGDWRVVESKIPAQRNKSSNQPVLPRLTFKRNRTNDCFSFQEVNETKIDPPLEKMNSEVQDSLMKVDSEPEEASALVMPLKKRRYVEPAAESSRQMSTVEDKQVAPQAMSSDESNGEQEAQDEKMLEQSPRKTELPEVTEEASSSGTSRGECKDEACAGPSGTSYSREEKPTMCRREFWLQELKKKFAELDHTKDLEMSGFSENQKAVLEESFRQLARKAACIEKNNKRFVKTHRCRVCDFSVSHHCLSLDLVKSVPFGIEYMADTYTAPSRTVICDCGFAFYHIHTKRMRSAPTFEYVERNTPNLQIYNHYADHTCIRCYTKIVLNKRSSNVCTPMTAWTEVGPSLDCERFYNAINSHLHLPESCPPLLKEFYSCTEGCCLLYHRCCDDTDVPGGRGDSPG